MSLDSKVIVHALEPDHIPVFANENVKKSKPNSYTSRVFLEVLYTKLTDTQLNEATPFIRIYNFDLIFFTLTLTDGLQFLS